MRTISIIGALLLVACSHSSKSEPPVVSPTSSGLGPPPVAVTYVSAFATGDPDVMADQMIPSSAPASPARTYADFQRAAAASHSEIAPLTTSVDGAHISVCTDAKDCKVFSDFAVDAAGLLAAFTIDGARVDTTMAPGRSQQTAGTATVRVVASALSSPTGPLAVALEIAAPSDDVQVDLGAITLDQVGQQRRLPVDTIGDGVVPAGVTHDVVVGYASSSLGGTVTITVSGAGLPAPQAVQLTL